MLQQALTTSNYLMRGFRLLRQPGIRPFVVLPLFVNALVFGGLGWLSFSQFASGLDYLMAYIPDWLDFVRWLLWPVFVILLLLVFGYTFSLLANIIAAPFNGLLAEKVETLVTGKPLDNQPSLWLSIPRSIGREISKLTHVLPLAIGVFILSLIPGLNTLAPVLWFLFGAWMLAIEYTDYPMDNHQISFSVAKQRLRNKRLASLGFGSGIMTLTMIPFVNLLVMPAAVCAGVLFYLEQLKEDQT